MFPVAFPNIWFKPALYPDILAYEKLSPEFITERILNELNNIYGEQS